MLGRAKGDISRALDFLHFHFRDQASKVNEFLSIRCPTPVNYTVLYPDQYADEKTLATVAVIEINVLACDRDVRALLPNVHRLWSLLLVTLYDCPNP